MKYVPQGDCFAYAIALAQRLGLKRIYFLVNKDEYYDWKDIAFARHAFVKYRGEFYDYKGRLSLERLRKEFRGGNKVVGVNLSKYLPTYKYLDILREAKSEVGRIWR